MNEEYQNELNNDRPTHKRGRQLEKRGNWQWRIETLG